MSVRAGAARRVLYLAWAPFFSGAERALLLTLRSLDRERYAPYVLAGGVATLPMSTLMLWA